MRCPRCRWEGTGQGGTIQSKYVEGRRESRYEEMSLVGQEQIEPMDL